MRIHKLLASEDASKNKVHGNTSKQKIEQKKRKEKAKVKWGEENERQMANNVMRGIRVCDGYLVCLDLCIDSPATAPEMARCRE